ncbi:Pro-rich N-terminal domain-containing protein, partial [Streptomyces shenzhenensis]
MQHAVGSPLPPPHQPGQEPAVGWSPAAHHPGAGAHQGPAPVPPPPPAPGFSGVGAPSGPVPPAPPRHTPAPPVPDATGHVPLPPGGP